MESSSKTSLYVGAAALVIVIVLVIIGLRTTKTTTENMPIINQQETTPGAQPADTTPLPTSTTTSPEKTKTMNTATLKTNMGEITISLDAANAPKTVENFTTLASKGFYDGIRFHRVIKGFMIQAGDPQSKDLTKYHYGEPADQDINLTTNFLEMKHTHKELLPWQMPVLIQTVHNSLL